MASADKFMLAWAKGFRPNHGFASVQRHAVRSFLRKETPMRILTPWTTAWIAAALVLVASVIAASAQIQTRGAAGLHAQIQNATPLVRRAACWGWGPYCPPGTVRRCGPYRCWCARC